MKQGDFIKSRDTNIILSSMLKDNLFVQSLDMEKMVEELYAATIDTDLNEKIDARVSGSIIKYWSNEIMQNLRVKDDKQHIDRVLGKALKLLLNMCRTESKIGDLSVYADLVYLMDKSNKDLSSIVELMRKLGMQNQQLLIPYNILMMSIMEYNSVETLLFDMEKNSVSPDAFTLNILLQKMSKRFPPSDPGRIVRGVKEQLKLLTNEDTIRPNDDTLQILTDTFQFVKFTGNTAVEMVEGVFTKIVEPSEKSYNCLISFLVESSLHNPKISEKVVSYILEANSNVVSIDANTIDSIITSWVSKGQSLLAAQFVDEILLPSGIIPSLHANRILLRNLCTGDNPLTEMGERLLVSLASSNAKAFVDSTMLQYVFMSLSSNSRAGNRIDRAERLWNLCVVEKNTKPTTVLINCLLDVYAKSSHINDDIPKMAENVLHNRFGDFYLQADHISFNTVINCFAQSNRPKSFDEALEVFDYACDLEVTLTSVSYTVLLKALSRSRRRDSIRIASYLFDDMINRGIEADVHVFTILLFIYSKHASIQKTQEVFQLMIDYGIEPSIVTYTQLLNMYGKSHDPDASKYIFDIFKRIKLSSMSYDTVAYSSLLSAISSSNNTDTSAERALEILQTMRTKGVEIDTQVITIVIGILSKSEKDYSSHCFSLYDELIQPTPVSFTTMLNYIKNVRRKESSGNLLQSRTYLDKIFSQMVKTDYVLDAQSLKSLASALSLSGTYTKIDTAEKLNYLTMKTLNASIIPDKSVFAVTFKAWLLASNMNSSYSLKQSSLLVSQMASKGIRPSLSCMKSVFSILMKVNKGFEFLMNTSVYFIDLYRNIQGTHRQTKDANIYFAVIELFERQRSLNRREHLLMLKKTRQLVDMIIEDGCDVSKELYLKILKLYSSASYAKPEVVIELQNLDALLRSRFEIKKCSRAKQYVLAAWARSFRNDTIQNAESVFNEITKSENVPDSLSYFYLFKAYSKTPIMTEQQFSALMAHFHTCVQLKQVDAKVLNVFIGTLSTPLMKMSMDRKKTLLNEVIKGAYSCGNFDINDNEGVPATNLNIISKGPTKIDYLSRISSIMNISLRESETLLEDAISH